MDSTGDIPEKAAVRPDAGDASDEAQRKARLVQSIIENGGVAHLYLPHLGPGDDRHCYQFNTHVFVDEGLIYVHGDDEDHWIPAEDITEIERHYET